jgi:hypothetical protein
MRALICPKCKNIIKEADEQTHCPRCRTTHHKHCWNEHGGCSVEDCFENPEVRENAEIVGNKTVHEILSDLKEEKSGMMQKGVCPECGKAFDTSLKKCYYCGYDPSENPVEPERQKSEAFEEEFKERLHKKSDFRNKQRAVFYSSIAIVAVLFGALVYFSYLSIDRYFKSEKYGINLFLKDWENALESKDILTYKELLDKDYQYIEKSGKPIGYDERVKRIGKMFETYKTVSVKTKNVRIEFDTVNKGYANITFHQITTLDKKEDKGIKTMRLYKTPDAGGKWKLFREYAE